MGPDGAVQERPGFAEGLGGKGNGTEPPGAQTPVQKTDGLRRQRRAVAAAAGAEHRAPRTGTPGRIGGKIDAAAGTGIEGNAVAEDIQQIGFEKAPVRGGGAPLVQVLQIGNEEPEQPGNRRTVRQEAVDQLHGIPAVADGGQSCRMRGKTVTMSTPRRDESPSRTTSSTLRRAKGSRAPPKRRMLLRAPRARPRTLPWQSVNRVTIRSLSR